SNLVTDGIAALQRLQEQTSALHQQYLASQETTQKTLLALIESQARGVPMTAIPVAAPQPVAAAPVPLPNPLPQAGEGRVRDSVSEALIAVVAEKTGYPPETLNLDMGLESDLGIDSIKRVEILAALREKLPNAPVVGPQHVGTLRTLRQIIEFMGAGQAPLPNPLPQAGEGRVRDSVSEALIAVVAEKTGYPPETLNLDMGLESDLGIDSIKRVEILAALRDKLPNAPVVGPEHVGTLRTLRQIIEFMGAGQAPLPNPLPQAGEGRVRDSVSEALIAVVAEKTGYPPETLNLDMGLESDLGIDSIKRVEILAALRERLPEAPTVGPEHVGTLRTLRQIIDFMTGGPSIPHPNPLPQAGEGRVRELPTNIVREMLVSALMPADEPRRPAALPAQGAFWVLDDGSELSKAVVRRLAEKGGKSELVKLGNVPAVPAELGGLVLIAPAAKLEVNGLWSESSERWLKDAFQLLRACAPALRKNAGAVFCTVSRLDGAFGLGALERTACPTSGALAGLAKTARLEWPEQRCKALDLDRAWTDLEAAAAAVVEELGLSGPVEVGLEEGGRRVLETRTEPAPASGPLPLAEDDVVVVTGGARGVTAEAALALAEAVRLTFVVLGRTPAPEPEPDWLKGLSAEGDVKKGVMKELGGKPAPKAIEEAYRRWMGNRELARNIARLEAAGAKVLYRSADLRDPASVQAALSGLPGPVRALVHGAGALADRHIEEKTPAMFDAVFDTKVGGLRTVLGALDLPALKAVALFSSVTGRLGRVGQADYAMANETLNKAAQSLSRRLPGCRVVSICWGPWEGGMVTPALKKVFEGEGVGLLPLREGGRHLVAELRGAGVETVVTGSKLATAADRAVAKEPAKLVVAFERSLDTASHPFLSSHVINGKAVLPLAMMAEWLAHAALHANPGLEFAGLDDLRVLKGVILDGAPRTVRAAAGKAAKEGPLYRVPVELQGEGSVVHARGSVLLGRRPTPPAPTAVPAWPAYPRTTERAYAETLFHGPHLQGITAVDGCAEAGIAVSVNPAPAPSAWQKNPLRSAWLGDPLALDAAFQAAILWSAEHAGGPCLPAYMGRYRQFAEFPKDGTKVVLRMTRRGAMVAADADFLTRSGALVARLEGSEHAVDAGLTAAFKKSTVLA
ncbi:SDR family NAD(P)-dependent oxidoreductase, partial [bacterium]